MGNYQYTNLTNASDILKKIRDALLAEGWIILINCLPDEAIDGNGELDGIRLAVKSPDESVWATFRTADGKKIFKTQANEANAYGIGLVGHEGFTVSPEQGFWFNQPNAPVIYGTDEAIGVGIPVNPNGNYTICINIRKDPCHFAVISVEDTTKKLGAPGTTLQTVWQHMAVGKISKIGDWEGGEIFSASRNSYGMFTQSTAFDPSVVENESLPLFSVTTNANTFLRANIDGAPIRKPSVLWASAGQPIADAAHAYTGKQIGLPVKHLSIKDAGWVAKIPDYVYLQSQTDTDSGRDTNALNCISVNEPLPVYILVDPDELRNFSPAGYIEDVYFISLKSVAAGKTYEINYPETGERHQVFPYTRRRGIYGYDGFSIRQ